MVISIVAKNVLKQQYGQYGYPYLAGLAKYALAATDRK